MHDSLIQYLKRKYNLQKLKATRVGGGDINSTFYLTSERGLNFLKYNTSHDFARMFEREADGLALLKESGAIRIPKVLEYGEENGISFLLLEWIKSRPETSPTFWQNFGQQLADLHQSTRPNFGLSHANFIGNLAQYNNDQENGVDFLIYERFEPQLFLAEEKNRISKSDRLAFEKLYTRLNNIIPDEFPALIHGDLWSGNWMVDEQDQPVLVDPAISYGLREMDLAMMTLFGQVPPLFFEAYHTHFPLARDWKNRLDIYQLYYLLVHLNLFGGSYVIQVRQILKKYQ